MEEKASILESLVDTAEDYGRSSIELAKLKAIKKIAEAVSSIASSIVAMFTMILFILILSIGLALWIGDCLGKTYWGFFIIAGVYLLVSVIFMAFKKQLVKGPVSNAIIKNIID